MAAPSTVDKLKQGNCRSLMHIVMQLRQICNHPRLFEEADIRTRVTPLRMNAIDYFVPSDIKKIMQMIEENAPNLSHVGLTMSNFEKHPSFMFELHERIMSGTTGSIPHKMEEKSAPQHKRLQRFLDVLQKNLLEEQQYREQFDNSLNFSTVEHSHSHPIFESNLINLLKWNSHDVSFPSENLLKLIKSNPEYVLLKWNLESSSFVSRNRQARGTTQRFIDTHRPVVAAGTSSSQQSAFNRTKMEFSDKRKIMSDCSKLVVCLFKPERF